MTARSNSDLAADVRAYLLKQTCSQEHHDALAALAELVARLEAAEAQVAALTQDNAVLRKLPSREVAIRAEAAEAQVAAATDALAATDGGADTAQLASEAFLPDDRPFNPAEYRGTTDGGQEQQP